YLRSELYYDGSSAARDLKVPLLYVGSEKMWAADMAWPQVAKRLGYDEVKVAQGRRVGGFAHFIMVAPTDSPAALLPDFARTLPQPASPPAILTASAASLPAAKK